MSKNVDRKQNLCSLLFKVKYAFSAVKKILPNSSYCNEIKPMIQCRYILSYSINGFLAIVLLRSLQLAYPFVLPSPSAGAVHWVLHTAQFTG